MTNLQKLPFVASFNASNMVPGQNVDITSPALAVQPGQTTLLNNPSQVEVYVDNNTQLLNTQNLAAGGTFRFYGLIFNDNGTLRMYCAQVSDGVPFVAPSNGNTHLEIGQARWIHRLNRNELPELITTVTRSR